MNAAERKELAARKDAADKAMDRYLDAAIEAEAALALSAWQWEQAKKAQRVYRDARRAALGYK